MEAQLLDVKGAQVGKVELRDAIFGRKASARFLHEYVTVYLANQRRGTAHTKTRAEVAGSGRKPWKQKHTGRARAGSFRSPLWRHGGITFGPRAGHVHLGFPRRKSRIALAQALSNKLAEGGIVFVDNLALENPKTKLVAELLRSLKCEGRTLFVLDAPDARFAQASRNIPDLDLALAGDLNAYTVMRCRRLVVTRPALEKLHTRCASFTEAETQMPKPGKQVPSGAPKPAAKPKVVRKPKEKGS